MGRVNTIQLLRGNFDNSPDTLPNLNAGEPVLDLKDTEAAFYVGEGTDPASQDKFFIGGGYGGTWSSAIASKPLLILENTNTDGSGTGVTFKKKNLSWRKFVEKITLLEPYY